ncbi:MAG: hypothetical protein ACK2TV_13935 [Anaerolineales bacterium]
MSHQPFENWLFSEEPLDSEQQQLLDIHMSECDRCRALSTALGQVELALASQITPEPGSDFVQRWQHRLKLSRQSRLSKKIWLLALGLFGMAGLIFLSLLLINLNTINWNYELGQFIANFSHFTGRINQFWNAFASMTDVFPILIPIFLIVGIGSLAAVSTLIIIWISSLSRLYRPIREGVIA